MGVFVNANQTFHYSDKMVFLPNLNPANYLKTDLIEPGLSDYHALLTKVKKHKKYKPIQNLNQASSLMEAAKALTIKSYGKLEIETQNS